MSNNMSTSERNKILARLIGDAKAVADEAKREAVELKKEFWDASTRAASLEEQWEKAERAAIEAIYNFTALSNSLEALVAKDGAGDKHAEKKE
jgi:hypothetical protein